LTKIVQENLISLGYDPGPANGEASTKTIIAVAKFQAQHNLDPNGEITPQLAGVMQATMSKQGVTTKPARPAAATKVVSTAGMAKPGETVRNVFGPDAGFGANQCRGACGGGCPKSCSIEVAYECTGSTQLRRVEAFTCGTHQGCREHDACLDNCMQNNPGSAECQPQCDATVMEVYGFESATSWLMGKGPYDGESIFEYTRHTPAGLEAAYRCPDGATRQCGDTGACIAANGNRVDPIFDSYPAGNAGAMQITGLRTGPLCRGGDKVCDQAATIQLSGADTCQTGACTRFGMEFDYRNADPAAPLECSTSTRGGEGDFVGDLIKLGGDALASRNAGAPPAEDDGMGQLLGMFAKVIASGDSPEDVQISMTVLDENGNPDESQRVGSEPTNGPAPIPRSINLPAENGHLFVPMYQLAASSKPGEVKERRVTCTHKGEPVLETVFVLQ
jgi:peptidoglycan hydrolase-like protein with peptidoglycan-binding domain